MAKCILETLGQEVVGKLLMAFSAAFAKFNIRLDCRDDLAMLQRSCHL